LISAASATREEMLEVLRAARAVEGRREKEDAERSLLSFVRLMWPAVEPETPFVSGWVLEAICEHLEAVTAGEITRLLINVPPGSTKSIVSDVMWPAWEWGPQNRPHLRYLCCAYAAHLTERDNRRFKRVIEYPVFVRHWGDRFAPQPDMYSTTQVGNDKTGWKLASSVGGVGTGERADRVIIDDPNNPQQAESELVMRDTTTWFREVMPDRLNSLAKSVIVVIQQRTHDLDVSGTILDLGLNYCHLSVPMRFDAKRRIMPTDIGWIDPRTMDEDGLILDGLLPDGSIEEGSDLAGQDGVLAWSERFSFADLLELEKAKGSYAFSAQYQMLPVPRGGGIIKDIWWQLWSDEMFPEYGTCVASLDTAFKLGQQNDYSALTVWAAFAHPDTGKPKLMLRDAWRGRVNLMDLVRQLIKTCRAHKVDVLLIEDAGRGGDVRDEIYRLLGQRDIRCQLIPSTRDKVARLNDCQPIFENEVVYAPDKDWAEGVIREVSAFPFGRHDDWVDTVSLALLYLRKTGVTLRREEFDEAETAKLMFKKVRRPVYDV